MKLPTIDPKKEERNIVGFIGKTFQNAQKHTAIVAVSGGVDSATSLLLSIKALGAENVIALHMPTRSSDPIHTKHVNELIKLAKLPKENFIIINIGSIVQKTWRAIKKFRVQNSEFRIDGEKVNFAIKGLKDRKEINSKIARLNKMRLANLSARVRMMVLYDQAKLEDALVVGTENYSEHLLGYYTRFGDEASDMEPLRNLYKTQVYDLAKYLGVPEAILEKEPTADLWTGQTDAKEMGFSYAEADPILAMYAEGKSSNEMIKAGFDKKLVGEVLFQVQANNFKHHVPWVMSLR